ncbi:hypothetical protein GUITHDRAFT_103287 [Guillardia theta CCMP2712]|nr:hypothetical protein GUITHDRAFT_104257 [Guillardia theta CCMP2712]XP_005837675.1 hypothetical protein GUITHDRAFT_103287 [Guillardia theta CCMP2712]EKX49862.1 hypothetical protein GUITHDRAFT_104257 [Guillardia theta CCMP2712]EKX50695.1 hypothetical protein GUITHDRAFT_103287 [Guillardia theta CCMP2712]|eukprot:XP_005836842.1 hypothetical protein GUITHDRAFT_104257 [Guillardia theta CCMP2712]
MFRRSDVLETLREVSEEQGVDFCCFGDSAYPLSRFMQHILKAPAEGELTRLERRYNALMGRFRIVIENCFGEATQYFGMLQHRHNLRLGSQQVGKLFPLAMFIFNIHTLFYGNQTTAYFEGEHMVLDVSVEDYLSLADEFQ